jgi:hypothetical protein
VRKGVKNCVASLSSIALNRFSPVHATIRLPPSSSEAMSNALPSIPCVTPVPWDDPPGVPIPHDDAPNYRGNRSLLREWESSEDYVTPRSQQPMTEPDSQPSLQNRNDVIPCDVPGFITPGVVEPGVVGERMLELKPSPHRFGEISNISPISSDESTTHPEPPGNSPVLTPRDASPQ